MWPRIGPLPTIVLCYASAFLLHYVVCWRIARRYALSWRVWLPISVLFSIAGSVGSRTLGVLEYSPQNWQVLFTVKHYTRVYGVGWGRLLAYLLLAVPAAWLLTSRKQAALDLVALTIPLPFVLAKMGCFCNGCCYGAALRVALGRCVSSGFPPRPGRYARSPHPTLRDHRYPGVSLRISKLDRRRWQGTMLLWFLAIEGATVATTECFRGDFQQHVCLGPVTLSQLLALIAATVSLVLLIVWARRFPPAPRDPAVARNKASCRKKTA